MVRAGGIPGLAFCVVALLGATSAAEPPFAIVGARVVAPDGTLTDGRAVVIADGEVRAVIARDRVEQGVRIRRHAGAVVSPGLIDPRSTLGVYGNNIERVRPIDAAAAVRSAVDRSHADFRAAMRANAQPLRFCQRIDLDQLRHATAPANVRLQNLMQSLADDGCETGGCEFVFAAGNRNRTVLAQFQIPR